MPTNKNEGRKRKAKFRVGQVVAFKVSGKQHFERVAHVGLIRGRILILTEHGFVSNLFGMRPLTDREKGR